MAVIDKKYVFKMTGLILIAGLCLGAALIFFTNGTSGNKVSTAIKSYKAIALVEGSMPISDDMRTCDTEEQCIVVDTNCGFCCNFVAIPRRHEQRFDAMLDKSCSRYEGEMCQCYDLTSYPACVKGRCTLLKWPDSK